MASSTPSDGAQRLEGFVRQQWWRSDPEAALVLPQSRDKVRNHRRDEVVAVAIKVAGVHPERDVLNSRQAAMRDIWNVHHGQRMTSLVLVMRTQVQPVSLQTRMSLRAAEHDGSAEIGVQGHRAWYRA